MKKFKIGDKIKSTKPGILNGLEGDILSIDPEKSKPICVVCGQLGTHYFSVEEVELIGEKQKPLNALEYNEGMYETEIKMPTEAKKRGRPAKVKVN